MLKQKSFLVIFLAILFLTSVPAFFVFNAIYPQSFEVPVGPYGEGDYYYDRIQEIKDGYPFLGNPYFFEHREDITPAFFLADWIASIPSLLDFSLVSTTLFNFFFWSLVFALIFAILLKSMGVGENWAIGGSIVSFLSVFNFMIRPVSMQVILPFFFIFILAFIFWWRSPLEKKQIFFLSITAALASYLYTYSAQIVIVFFILTIIHFCFLKDKKFLKGILFSFGGFFVLMLPFVFFTLKQISNPYYFETMRRIGLVENHIPIGLFFISSSFVIFGIILVLCFYRKPLENNNFIFSFLIIFGISLIGVSGSNIITGKELENPQHIERYIVPFLVLLAVFTFWVYFRENYKINFSRRLKVIFLVSSVIIFLSILRYLNMYGPLTVFHQNENFREDWSKIQTFKKPIGWSDREENKPVVVFANPTGKIANYVSMLSKHYVLFNPSGVLHLLSGEESLERYLIANYFVLTKQKLIDDFRIYAGMGNGVHSWKANNRKVMFCRAFYLDKLGVNCGEKVPNALSWKGESYFDSLFNKFQYDIKPDIYPYLLKYNVTYVIKDNFLDKDFMPKDSKNLVEVYNDGDFSIYKIKSK